MQFAPPRKRQPREAIVPMINVVFLLLIFFLMTATIAPPDPLDVSPPRAAAEATDRAEALSVTADGRLAFGSLRGPAAISAAVDAGAVRLRVDANLPGSDLARLMTRLAAQGARQVQIVTVMP